MTVVAAHTPESRRGNKHQAERRAAAAATQYHHQLPHSGQATVRHAEALCPSLGDTQPALRVLSEPTKRYNGCHQHNRSLHSEEINFFSQRQYSSLVRDSCTDGKRIALIGESLSSQPATCTGELHGGRLLAHTRR
ncbi:hypothetical protein E2C01_098897 [Portunus trituberculatus]|uniref:Uncharacterized protein n=1 Tax=Portunus trituberculatus TaxID=210409 RepID=A0A5B7KE11_PORTR|nr:hypothetical protein [Portunus trituberculatus]